MVPKLVGVHGKVVTWGNYGPASYRGEFQSSQQATNYAIAHTDVSNGDTFYVVGTDTWLAWNATGGYLVHVNPPSTMLPNSPFANEAEATAHAGAVGDLAVYDGNVWAVTAFTPPTAGQTVHSTKRIVGPYHSNPTAYWWLAGQDERLPVGALQAAFPYQQNFAARLRLAVKGAAPDEALYGAAFDGMFLEAADVTGLTTTGAPAAATDYVVFQPPVGVYEIIAHVEWLTADASYVDTTAVVLFEVDETGADDVLKVMQTPRQSIMDLTPVISYPVFHMEVDDLILDGTRQLYFALSEEEEDVSGANYFRGYIRITRKA